LYDKLEKECVKGTQGFSFFYLFLNKKTMFFVLLLYLLMILFLLLFFSKISHYRNLPVESWYPPTVPLVQETSYRGTVPLLFHQTLPRRELHETMFQHLLQHNRTKAPEFSFHFYDDGEMENVIEKHFGPRVIQAYRRINPKYGACRSDLARYCILYVFGGIYLDIKSEVRQSPVPLLETVTLVHTLLGGHWKHASYHADTLGNQRGEIMNWVMASTPRHPLLLQLIMNITSRIESGDNGVGKPFVLELTGPIALTRVALSYRNKSEVIVTDDIHKYFKYNSERCKNEDCRSLFYKTVGVKAYDEYKTDRVILS